MAPIHRLFFLGLWLCLTWTGCGDPETFTDLPPCFQSSYQSFTMQNAGCTGATVDVFQFKGDEVVVYDNHLCNGRIDAFSIECHLKCTGITPDLLECDSLAFFSNALKIRNVWMSGG